MEGELRDEVRSIEENLLGKFVLLPSVIERSYCGFTGRFCAATELGMPLLLFISTVVAGA